MHTHKTHLLNAVRQRKYRGSVESRELYRVFLFQQRSTCSLFPCISFFYNQNHTNTEWCWSSCSIYNITLLLGTEQNKPLLVQGHGWKIYLFRHTATYRSMNNWKHHFMPLILHKLNKHTHTCIQYKIGPGSVILALEDLRWNFSPNDL